MEKIIVEIGIVLKAAVAIHLEKPGSGWGINSNTSGGIQYPHVFRPVCFKDQVCGISCSYEICTRNGSSVSGGTPPGKRRAAIGHLYPAAAGIKVKARSASAGDGCIRIIYHQARCRGRDGCYIGNIGQTDPWDQHAFI